MNKFTMVATVVIVAGAIYMGSYLAAYGVLYSSPQQTTTLSVSTTSVSSSSPPISSTSHSLTSTSSFSSASSTSSSLPSTSSTSSTASSSAQQTISSSATSSQTGSTGGQQVSITLVIDSGGWNNSNHLALHIVKGSSVTFNIVYQDPYGDEHPLFLSGYNINGPTMSPADTHDSIQFVASTAGTFTILCLNPDCTLHNLISGTMVITVS